MTKNPFVNAVSAILYIALVASIMFYGVEHNGNGGPPSIIVPIAMISLFTLSAAMMGYIFLSQPLQLYIDGKKKVAVNLFLKTLGVFAGITALIFTLFLSRVFS